MRISEKKLTGRNQSIMALVAKKKRQKKAIIAVCSLFLLVVSIPLFSSGINLPAPTQTPSLQPQNNHSHGGSSNSGSSSTVTTVDPKFRTVQAFIAGAKEVGWSQDQLAVEYVSPGSDYSNAGSQAFLDSGAKTIPELLGWLGGDSRSAEGTRLLIAEYTGASDGELRNPNYWVVAQAQADFRYTEMTLWRNGKIHTQGGKTGNPGDIFFAFVPPRNESKIVYVRGGCANPTLNIPTPNQPTPTTRPTTTQPPVDEPEPTTRPSKPGETTTKTKPSTTKPTTTKPTTTLKAKDPTKDILANPKVADWKKNGGELLQILWDLDAPNGYQPAPREEAKAKADAINKTNKELEQKHSEAVTQAPTVDGNQGHVAVTKPNSDPNWSPFG